MGMIMLRSLQRETGRESNKEKERQNKKGQNFLLGNIQGLKENIYVEATILYKVLYIFIRCILQS